LRADSKQLKAKLRLKAETLTQQEKSVLDLERAEETGRHMVEEKGQELLRSKDREERQRQDNEDLKRKLAEAHEVLKNNHDVIEYLNKQLTERELKALPPVVAGLTTSSERDGRSNALMDLLKRTEGLGRGLNHMGLTAGSAPSPMPTSSNMTSLFDLGLSSGSAGLGGMGLGLSTGRSSGLRTSGLPSGFAQQSIPGTGASVRGPGTSSTGGLSAEMRGVTDAGGYHSLGSTAPIASLSSSLGASAAAGRNPLSGPVAYRSPSETALISVK